MEPPDAPLRGYVVVELSTGIAGAYCTKLLADGGADVLKVEDPGGDPLRRWSASGAAIPPDGDGALFGFLACSKESFVGDAGRAPDVHAVGELLAAADAVVWSPGSRLADHPDLSPTALRRAHPHLTITAISPFGLEGPWSGRPATDFTLQAWSGGIIGLGRGSPDRPPVQVGGRVVEWLGGVYAAIGTLASRARGSARGELVDVSLLEAAALALTYYPVTFADVAGRPYRPQRAVPVPGVESASDGYVGLGTGTGQQWLDFCVMLGHPEWADDPGLRSDRAPIAEQIRGWMAARPVAEIMQLASMFRIPCAPIGNGATLPSTSHFRQRDSFVTNPRDGFTQPAAPYRFTPCLHREPGPAPRLGEHAGRRRPAKTRRDTAPAAGRGITTPARLPLAGLRILDMTAFWAGPLCGHILAMLGAEVLHLESAARPDGTRALSGLPLTEDRWWERSGIFSGLNTNKKSVTLDLRDERGRAALRDLIATSDVLVENFTPRVLEQLGLDFPAVQAIRPDIVMVRMPGFGLAGPWRDNSAFAFVIEDASGLTWLTGHPDENPLSPYCLGDPTAGLHAVVALLLALEHRRQTGQAVLVEAAMADAAINIAAEQVVEFSAYGALLTRDGNRGTTASPQNLYRTRADREDDAWVAIAIQTADQWVALRDRLGRPAWAMDPELLAIDVRKARRDAIDQHLAAWCAVRPADDVVEQLWEGGIPVARVVQPHQQADLPQLRHRAFFEDVEHPVAGSARHSTLPMRFSAGPDRFHRRHAPLLGEHTREVLAAIGMSAPQIAALEAGGVIGTAPLTSSGAPR